VTRLSKFSSWVNDHVSDKLVECTPSDIQLGLC